MRADHGGVHRRPPTPTRGRRRRPLGRVIQGRGRAGQADRAHQGPTGPGSQPHVVHSPKHRVDRHSNQGSAAARRLKPGLSPPPRQPNRRRTTRPRHDFRPPRSPWHRLRPVNQGGAQTGRLLLPLAARQRSAFRRRRAGSRANPGSEPHTPAPSCHRALTLTRPGTEGSPELQRRLPRRAPLALACS